MFSWGNQRAHFGLPFGPFYLERRAKSEEELTRPLVAQIKKCLASPQYYSLLILLELFAFAFKNELKSLIQVVKEVR